MSDFDSSVPIKTEVAGDVSVKVVDSANTSNQLKVEANGSLNVNSLGAGTSDGQVNGPIFYNVNNIKTQILAAHDREQSISYADFGTKDQRITQIDYSSDTFPGFTARKEITYTLVGTRYRRDTINWSIV